MALILDKAKQEKILESWENDTGVNLEHLNAAIRRCTILEFFNKCYALGAGTCDGAQEEEIKALFDMIDKDKSGSLSQRVNVIDGSVDYYGNFHY